MDTLIQNPVVPEGGLPRLAITVEEFAAMLSLSERSAWTVIKTEAVKAEREGRPNRLPLVSPIDGGQTRRLRMSDVQNWLNGLA